MKKTLVIGIILITACGLVRGQESDTKKVIRNIPGGYESLSWGSKLKDSRSKIKGKLYFTDEKSIIISRQGELEYQYGFFYIDPAAEGSEAARRSESTDTSTESTDEGKLFYVALRFPYIAMEDIKKKIEDKYGPSTTDNLNKNQGAVAWNGEKTIIVMWVDNYEDKPYCRRITYVSKEITKELNEYQERIFNKVERELIKNLP